MLSCVQETISVQTRKQGLLNITDQIEPIVVRSGMHVGLCTVFVQHTSCSLVIQENADPTARADLENWINRLAPENDPRYTHTLEGPDDMPAHLKAAVTRTSEQIPITAGRLGLGTWQGLYLWEHRHQGATRKLVITLLGESK
ncbi:MAG: secondary thiamine-phosphate synthase enzyme YjbQ [Myxococcota bacterium]|nr:secondary thiamine-phosphate synthase enzyme YjbQ [Myxococcota bacterium]